MALFHCFSKLVGRKKKVKDAIVSSSECKNVNENRTLQVKVEHPVKPSEHEEELKSTSFSVPVPFDVTEISRCEVKVMNPVEKGQEEEAVEVAYEGEDEHEHDEKSPMSRENSDSNLEGRDIDSSNPSFQIGSPCAEQGTNDEEVEIGQGGHVSDPGMAREERWASPKLTRSCSNLDSREVLKRIADQLPPSKTQSFEQLQELANRVRGDLLMRSPCSQSSARTHCSADKVMLKKHSSSQILPSRSKRMWWKLFLWSHRNLQKPAIASKSRMSSLLATVNQQGGYSSDTLEPYRAKQLCKVESAGSFSELCSYKSSHEEENGLKGGFSGLWPQNQWIAFSGESSSSLKRVDDWVKDLEFQPTTPVVEEENGDEQIVFPSSPKADESMAKYPTHSSRHTKSNLSEELQHANSVIQSLNSSSTVAHVSGMGLKVIPIISHFSSLRSINLSNNSIAQITQGSLPKGLHVLDLSRNRITTIEGLRELTRLRVLDLSYNRISRIGHGLSSCILLKELYLAGNKISEVEGLHRLLKLTVLDLSFNKITTTKALGQLVANYNSLVALSILGNPIHSNLSSDQLRRAVCGLLPKLAYLNKQPINPQKAREVSMDIIAKSSSRNNNWNACRKSVKKSSQSGLMSSSTGRSSTSVGQRSRNKAKRQANQQSRLKTRTVIS
ncbi:uncharacterized protein LOC110706597 [Chenopodium quinoa]|uniref:uncharacterized protein LOC110706597 n=1 Tax=Chenopodium quinoa TaxID=63459 RepID=UPI000B77EB46|nr:uncharacterized protein LOC110706597 [Chenopodium quinoa]